MESVDLEPLLASNGHIPIDMRFAPYYGCMLNRPHALRSGSDYYGIMEKTLTRLSLQPLNWSYASHCCGTFLTVARPDIVTPKVNAIMQGPPIAGPTASSRPAPCAT